MLVGMRQFINNLVFSTCACAAGLIMIIIIIIIITTLLPMWRDCVYYLFARHVGNPQHK